MTNDLGSDSAKRIKQRIDELRDEWNGLAGPGTRTERHIEIASTIERLQSNLKELTGEQYCVPEFTPPPASSSSAEGT
jgi:hypothetical protein